MYFRARRLSWLGASTGLLCLASQVHAGGFALVEHGASGLGNAYAGAAAVSADTSTVWFNPAGMTELKKRELAVAAHVLSADTKFTDQGTALNPLFGSTPISGPTTAQPGTTTVLPNFYYVAPINDQWTYGLSVGVPFGSSTDYNSDWVGRYTTTGSGVNAIDINPAIAYRLSEKVRLGGGISIQRLTANLENSVDSGAVCVGALGRVLGPVQAVAQCGTLGILPGIQANDGAAKVTGDSIGVSFNLGALFLPKPGVKIGVAYRHSISHKLDGKVDFTTDGRIRTLFDQVGQTQVFTDGKATAAVDLPATGWSSFQELRVQFDGRQDDTFSTQDWDDVIRLSAGVNFQQSDKLTLRAGLAWDEEPIPSAQRRTARIPGNDRTWIAFGAGYEINKQASFDVGFTHIMLDQTPIDNSNSESAIGTTVRGLFDSSVNILSAQFNWRFQ